MSSTILNLDVEKSAVTPFNWATTSCIASRIVPLNVHKNGGRICSGFCEKSVSYNTYSSDSSSWIINGLVCSCSTNVDISDDESGMASGGGQGGQNLPPPVPCSPASRTFNSRLPPFTVLLPTPVNWQSRIIIIIFI